MLANGYTGPLDRVRPYSWIKIAFAVAAAAIALLVLLLVFGGNR